MNSKQRGGSYEREISSALSSWWTNGERDDIFYRSHSSGGRFTMRKKNNKDTAMQAGDITCSDSCGELLIKNWNIEVKTGYGTKKGDEIVRWDILDFIDSKQKMPVLQSMWDQCTRDAGLTNRVPILIFRRNGRQSCICFDEDYFNKLTEWFGDSCPLCIQIKELVIMPLKGFFEWIPNIRCSLGEKK